MDAKKRMFVSQIGKEFRETELKKHQAELSAMLAPVIRHAICPRVPLGSIVEAPVAITAALVEFLTSVNHKNAGQKITELRALV